MTITVYYPDIASYQAGIDLSKALAVCAKVTEGTGYLNPQYAAFSQRAAKAGAFFFAYHFLRQGDAAGQASWCHRNAVSVPLMLDVEPEQGAGSSPSLADATGFIDAYRKAGGACWLLYLPRWYWQQLGSPSLQPFVNRGMLLVSSAYTAYTDANTGAGWQPYGGMTPTVWQYTSTLNFGGLADVDFNAFRGSKYAGKQDAASVGACLGEFRSLVTTGKYPAPATRTVPNVLGMTAQDAADTLWAAGLHPHGLPLAHVTAQTPKAGVKVPDGTVVNIVTG